MDRNKQVNDQRNRKSTDDRQRPASMNARQPIELQKHRATKEEISRRAYEIWQERGQPLGQDLEHWFQAERELSRQYQRMN